MRPIVILTGPSGAGKTSLMEQAVAVGGGLIVRLRTVTTRSPRDPVSDRHYLFADRETFMKMVLASRFAEHDVFNPENPHLYGTPHAEFERVGPTQVGVKDLTEPGLRKLMELGRYRIIHVRIRPVNYRPRDPSRIEADRVREELIPDPPAPLLIENDHADPSGFQKAAAHLTKLLVTFASES